MAWPYAVWPDPRSRSRSRVIESHSRGVDHQSRTGLNFNSTILTLTTGYALQRCCREWCVSECALILLFGSKLGFSQILDSLSSALVWCSHVRELRQKWTDLDEIWSTLSTLGLRPWQILGTIHAVPRARKAGNFFQVNNAQLYQFPVGQILRNSNIAHWSVSWRILSEQNFENFPIIGRFSKKKNFFNILRLQATITPQWLWIDENSLPNENNPSTGCVVSIVTFGINSLSFPGRTLITINLPPNFLRQYASSQFRDFETGSGYWVSSKVNIAGVAGELSVAVGIV